MRSAQTPCGVQAIMKKFIYACNEKHYMLIGSYDRFSISAKCEQNMNEI